jgi:hypothetical protein
MKGAALLDIATYEEVEADTTATAQAAGVVAIVAVCSAIGAAGSVHRLAGLGRPDLPHRRQTAERYRDLGRAAAHTRLAQALGVFLVFGAIPVLGWAVLAIPIQRGDMRTARC